MSHLWMKKKTIDVEENLKKLGFDPLPKLCILCAQTYCTFLMFSFFFLQKETATKQPHCSSINPLFHFNQVEGRRNKNTW